MLYRKLYRKKHTREDGWLAELVSKAYSDEPFNCIHSYLVIVEPKRSRAGHYHNKKEEWFCVTSGRIELVLEDIKTKTKDSVPIDCDSAEYDIIYIPAGVAHLIKNTSRTDRASLVVFSMEPEDPKDTIKYEFESE